MYFLDQVLNELIIFELNKHLTRWNLILHTQKLISMFKLSTYLTLQKLHKHISKCAVRCLHYKRYLMLAQLLQFQALPAEYLSRQEKHYICLVIQIFNPKIYLTAHSWT